MPLSETLAYYEQHAASFAAETTELDLAPLYGRFLRHLRPGGRILDAGCGAGRDCLAFAERGYRVDGFDAAPAMVALARQRVGARARIHHLAFADVTWKAAFDGIWCCAALLHVPSRAFPAVAARLVQALKLDGIWYLSFKQGEGEHQRHGRLFVDHTETTLRQALAALPLRVEEVWVSTDLRPGRAGEAWLNAILRRDGGPAKPARSTSWLHPHRDDQRLARSSELQVAPLELPLGLPPEDAAEDRVQRLRVIVEAAMGVAARGAKIAAFGLARDDQGRRQQLHHLRVQIHLRAAGLTAELADELLHTQQWCEAPLLEGVADEVEERLAIGADVVISLAEVA
jgi:SAM-dependent methyltransferase